MTIINTFLQRKKPQEFSYGIYMVFAAYVLSILLLIIGSDTLYNITSKANGLSTQPDEVNQEVIPEENEVIIDSYATNNTEQESHPSEYQQFVSVSVSDDTNWLLGYAMNDEEYDRMLSHMNHSEVFSSNEVKTISSFSTTTLTNDISKDYLAMDNVSKDTVSAALVTKDERKMLEQIVEAEATGEDIIGKILVANVIFNRTRDEDFPNTIKEVIFQKVGDDYQFSPIADKRYWKVKVTEETKEAVQRALDGEDYSEGALYFMARKLAKKSNAKWFDNNLKWLFKHGTHEFFK